MKRAMIVCGAVVALGSVARAVEVKYGAKLGVNLAKHTYVATGGSGTSDSATGAMVGCTVEIVKSELISFQTGLQVVGKGGESTDLGEIDIDGLEIPALVKFTLAGGKAYLAAGVNLGFIIEAEQDTTDIKDDLKAVNLDLALGGGVLLAGGKLSVGVQYDLGLTNVADWSAADVALGYPSEIKDRTLGIVVGYTF